MAFTTFPGGTTTDKFLTDLKKILIPPEGYCAAPSPDGGGAVINIEHLAKLLSEASYPFTN